MIRADLGAIKMLLEQAMRRAPARGGFELSHQLIEGSRLAAKKFF